MRATKVKADRNFRKFFTDSSRAYDLEFMAMTAASAEKCSTAPESLIDTYKEYFAKDSAALDAIEGDDKQTIVDAAAPNEWRFGEND